MPSFARAASWSASSRSLLDFVFEIHTPSFTGTGPVSPSTSTSTSTTALRGTGRSRLGQRQGLPIHEAHTAGLTRLFRHAAGTIGARSTPGGGRRFHCDGTGLARPLWESAAGHA
ncbi:hypothetical protein [Streptomyces litmocidini]|uniref:hypothetical protein n=1 Tax=Streptomyces litmocidini TaxID=67318 RepID=UPI0037008BE5